MVPRQQDGVVFDAAKLETETEEERRTILGPGDADDDAGDEVDMVVATPSASWTLLQRQADVLLAASVEAASVRFDEDDDADDDDDDGLSFEEQRLERVSERLEALERDAPVLRALATPDDVAAADEVSGPHRVLAPPQTTPLAPAPPSTLLERRAMPTEKDKQKKKRPTKAATLALGLVASLAVVLAFVRLPRDRDARRAPSSSSLASSLLSSRDATPPAASSVLPAAPLLLLGSPVPPRAGVDAPRDAMRPAPRAVPSLDDLLARPTRKGGAPGQKSFTEFSGATLDDLERRFDEAKQAFRHLAAEAKLGRRVLCSVGLGALGLAVGVPYVPGLADNLLVGAVGAVLPLFRSSGDDASGGSDISGSGSGSGGGENRA